MALLAMLSVPALAQPGCIPAGALATVSYSEGVIPLASSTASSFPWLAGQGVQLTPPAQAGRWLKCATWWSLGPDRTVNAGESVGIACDTDVCDVYAFLYHEPPRSSATNGDLPAILPPAGWTPASCAPMFSDPNSNGNCRMTAFRKQLELGESATIDIAPTEPAMYLVIAVAPGVKCDSNALSTQATCEAPEDFLAKSCAWEGGACVDKWCERPTGPQVNLPQPTQCTAPLAEAPVVFSTGVDNNRVALSLNDVDTHWLVRANSGAWVQPLQQHTNKYSSGQTVNHPWLAVTGAGVPDSMPLAHPNYYGLSASSAGVTFSWKQTFNLPAGAVSSFVINYRAGWDDRSLQSSGTGTYASACGHTVWVNNNPLVQSPLAVSGATTPNLQTACLGSISGPWVPGPNTIEFRIRNVRTYYGFRFIVMP